MAWTIPVPERAVVPPAVANEASVWNTELVSFIIIEDGLTRMKPNPVVDEVWSDPLAKVQIFWAGTVGGKGAP